MEDTTIQKRFKRLRAIFLVNVIGRILFSFLFNIVTIFLVFGKIMENDVFIRTHWAILLWCGLIKTGVSVACFIFICSRKQVDTAINSKDYTNVLNSLFKTLLIGGIYIATIIITCVVCIFLRDAIIPYALGRTFWGALTFTIGYILLIITYKQINREQITQQFGSVEKYKEALQKYDKMINNYETTIRKQEIKFAEEHKLEIEQQKNIKLTLELFEEIGRKFFIKYYEKLKSWSMPDIIDVIEENYSEESKLTRIKKAKKIFELNLNVIALEIISNDKQGLTDDETLNKAVELLQKEKDKT